MCFSIPCKIERVEGRTAIIEGGKKVRLDKTIDVKKGEYLQVVGNIAVGKISEIEGQKIRNLIKSIYEGR